MELEGLRLREELLDRNLLDADATAQGVEGVRLRRHTQQVPGRRLLHGQGGQEGVDRRVLDGAEVPGPEPRARVQQRRPLRGVAEPLQVDAAHLQMRPGDDEQGPCQLPRLAEQLLLPLRGTDRPRLRHRQR